MGWQVFRKMGLAGAAVGSLVAVCIRAVCLIGCLWRVDGTDIVIPVWSRCTLIATMRRHFSLAWPIAGSFISFTVAMSVCMLLYSQPGINEFAAQTLIFPWIRIGGLLVTALAQAMGICCAPAGMPATS